MADDENKTTHEEPTEEKPDQVSLNEDSMEKSDLSGNPVDEEERTENESKDLVSEDDDEEDDDDDDNKDSEKDEKLPPGLLEQPLEVQGKREKKKVDRLSAAMVPTPKEKKKIEIEQGTGVKLTDVPYIENKLNATKAMDLKPLHHLLFLSRMVSRFEMKRNIRQFCGFTHAKDSKEHEKRVAYLNKMFMPEIKSLCLVLGLERKGNKTEIVERIMDFLMKPSDMGVQITEKVKRKSKSSTVKAGEKRTRTPKTKKPKAKPKVTKKAKKDDVDDDDSLEDDDDEEDEGGTDEEAPKKKKAKVEPKKSVSKQNGKKEKTPAKKDTKKVPPKKKKEILDSLSDDSDSDDETLINLKKNVPPSNDEIKGLVKKILDGADLETVTMKTVVKQVYGEYPSFDLSDRKDFIKQTVREIIS